MGRLIKLVQITLGDHNYMGCHIYGDDIAVLEEEEGIGDKIEDTLSIDETRHVFCPNS